MDKNKIEEAVAYMSKCPLCAVATASLNSEPSISTVYFDNIGFDIYFNTARDSQKVHNIMTNPLVAIAMQANWSPKTDREIKGIQYNGRAQILTEAETAQAPKSVIIRHRAFNNANPGSSIVVKVTPTKIFLVDYSIGFRHRDVLLL